MKRSISRSLVSAAFAAALCAANAAAAQDGPGALLDRMFGNRPQAPVPQQQSGGQDSPYGTETDQVMRIERLEAQIRQLTGQLEQMQYRNRQLEAQISSMGGVPAGSQPTPGASPGGAPAPAPGQAMQGQPIQGRPPSAAATALPPPAATPGRRSDVFDPSQNPNAPGAPRTLGTMHTGSEPPQVVMADPPTVGAPGGRAAGAPLDLSTMAASAASEPVGSAGGPGGALPPPPARNLSATGAVAAVAPPAEQPKDYYDLGYGYLLRKDYAQAEETFQAFLKKFPNDRRAAEAQFWLGESLFQRQRYDAAAQSFLDLSTRHGSHPKAPDALLRLGQSLAALKQKEMACATLAEIGRKYPRASTSVKQGVEREQKRVHC